MAYEPTIWKTGDVITADKLNKIEQGLASIGNTTVDHPVVVLHSDANGVFDHTWQEVKDLYDSGKILYIDSHLIQNENDVVLLYGSLMDILSVYTHFDSDEGENYYVVDLYSSAAQGYVTASSSSVSDYPVIEIDGGGK